VDRARNEPKSRLSIIVHPGSAADEPQLRASSKRFYRPELDVLRFVAFLMVYLGHALSVDTTSPRWLQVLKHAAGFGVPLFFALSAYLITELLTVENRIAGSVNVRGFYCRRILRIWPLYFTVLIGGFLISRLLPGEPIPLVALLSYVFLVGNWYTGLHGYLSTGLAPLWSIPIEEQFYLLWPLLLRYATRRGLIFICFLAWICSQALVFIFCFHHALNNPTIWTNSIAQLQYFAIGAGTSLLLNGSLPKLRGSLRLALVVSALLLFAMADFVAYPREMNSLDEHSSVAHTYPQYLFASVTVALMLVAFLGYSSFGRWKTLRYLGKISYGLYVYHIPALLFLFKVEQRLGWGSPFVVAVLGIPMTVSFAWLSYEYLERPFMRMKERFEVVKTREA
jgi:peptidoglycan/LPS O-acetylase OafA/YrhL